MSWIQKQNALNDDQTAWEQMTDDERSGYSAYLRSHPGFGRQGLPDGEQPLSPAEWKAQAAVASTDRPWMRMAKEQAIEESLASRQSLDELLKVKPSDDH